jgi:hypothetical protein
LDTLVLDSCQKIDVKEFENLKFCNQLSNLNAGFTNLDGETLVKVINEIHIQLYPTSSSKSDQLQFYQ